MLNRCILFVCLFFCSAWVSGQKIGINTTTPDFDLDVRGTDDTNDGGELQLATPSQTNFLRFFGGRLGDHHPFMAFSDMDTFHLVTTLADWSTYTRRMTMLPSGRIGIGLQNPQSLLHILGGQWNLPGGGNGDLKIGNDLIGMSVGVALDGGGAGISRIYAKGGAAKLIFGSDNTDVMAIDSANHVGIGTMNPVNRLDIKSDGFANASTIVLGLVSDVSNRPVLQFSEWDSAVPNSGMAIEYDGSAANQLNFLGTDGLPKMSVVTTGNVGIGTSSPGELLEVGGNGRVFIGDGNGVNKKGLLIDAVEPGNYVRLNPYDNGTSTNMDLYLPTKVGIGTTIPGELLEVGGNGRVFIGDGNGANKKGLLIDAVEPGNYVRLNPFNNGTATNMDLYLPTKVGIGTAVPTAQLQVLGAENDGTNATLKISNVAGGQQDLLLDGNEIDAVSTSLRLQANTTNNLVMVTGGGNVGIGTVAPNAKLEVNGNVTIGNTPPASGYILSVKGKIIAEEVRVQLQVNWPDYVFGPEHKLMDLETLENYLSKQKHLPGIPSASDIAENGLMIGEMQASMMEKIEELTLYVIALNKRVQALSAENANLQKQLEQH